MRVFSADPNCYLIEGSDLEQDAMPSMVKEHLAHVTTIFTWAKEYLSRPHAELGRDGSVCPFVPYALARQLFFVTIQPGTEHSQSDVYQTVLKYRDWFMEMEPREAPAARYKSINILFPDIPVEKAPEVIDSVQLSLKSEFVAKGLMIGQFHQTPPIDGGLWNPDFRPLKSPLPLLSIRHMVPTDFPFLTKDKDYVLSYLKIYGNNLPQRMRPLVKEVAREYGIELPGEI